ELVIGWTLAFASLGGILVTEVYNLIVAAAQTPGYLPHIPFPEGHDPANVAWRYTLLTGLIPGALILLLMPFGPESRGWSGRERRGWWGRKRAGTRRRPRSAGLSAPDPRRTTIVTALPSACASAAALGALQLTPPVISTGLPDLAGRQAELGKREAGLKTDRENLAKNKAELAKQTGEGAAAGKARIAQSEA